jgi:hypothetical protein
MNSSGKKIQPMNEAPPWTRGASIALAALILGAGITLAIYVHPYFDATNDGAVYILTAESLLDGEGYTYLDRPLTLRPPGYAVALMPLLAVAGMDFYILNMLTALFGVGCVALLFVHLRPTLGTAISFAVAAAVWLNPGFERLTTQVMSDVPGATLMVLCFVVERWARRNPSRAKDLLIGLCIAGAAYFRTIFVLILPAILCFRFLEWRRQEQSLGKLPDFLMRRVVLLAGVVILLMLPWQIRNSVVRSPQPTEHTWNYSYWVSMWHTDRSDPDSPRNGISEMRRPVKRRAGELVTVLGGRMQTHHPSMFRTTIGLIGLSCWLIVLFRRKEPAEIFGLAAMLVLTIYYSSRPRLALPVYLIMFPAVVEVALMAFRRIRLPGIDSRRMAQFAVAALVTIIVFMDLDPGADRLRIARRHQRFTLLARYLNSEYPGDMRFAAKFGGIYSIYLDRPVYSYGPACRRNGEAGMLQYVERYDIGGLIVNNESTQHCALPEFLKRHAARIDTVSPLLHIATLGVSASVIPETERESNPVEDDPALRDAPAAAAMSGSATQLAGTTVSP